MGYPVKLFHRLNLTNLNAFEPNVKIEAYFQTNLRPVKAYRLSLSVSLPIIAIECTIESQ